MTFRAPLFTKTWAKKHPVELLTWISGTTALLLAPAVVLPFNQTSWPNPVRKPPQVQQPHVNPFNLNLLPSDDIMTGSAVARVPAAPNRTVAVNAQMWVANPALYFSTPVVDPFNRSDWPNPITLVRRYRAVDAVVNPSLYYPATAGDPFNQGQWPNPVRRPVQGVSLHAQPPWFDPTVPPLRTRGPHISRPAARPVAQQPHVLPNLMTTTLAPGAVQLPFNQDKWPNPRLRYTPNSGFSYSHDLSSLPVAPVPFRQDQWPNPRLRTATPNSGIGYAFDLASMPAAPVPFNQLDWPNPVRRKAAANVGVIDGSFFALYDSSLPLNSLHWALPVRGRQPPLQAFVSGLPQYLYAEVLPFNQQDWPNPRRRVVLNSGFSHSHALAVFPPVAFPFNQYDWPNPKLPKRSVDLLTWNPYRMQVTFPPTVSIVSTPFLDAKQPVDPTLDALSYVVTLNGKLEG